MNLNKYAKAIVGALVAGLAVLQTAMQDEVMTNNEWVAVAAAVVGALGLIWAVPNSNGPATAPTLGGPNYGGDPYTPPLVVEGGMGPDLGMDYDPLNDEEPLTQEEVDEDIPLEGEMKEETPPAPTA